VPVVLGLDLRRAGMSEFGDHSVPADQSIHKKMGLHPSTKRMEHYERHCPTDALRLHCPGAPAQGVQGQY